MGNSHNTCDMRVQFATVAMHKYQLPVATKGDIKCLFEEKHPDTCEFGICLLSIIDFKTLKHFLSKSYCV